MLDIDFLAPGMKAVAETAPPFARVAGGLSFGEGPVWDSKTGALYFVDIIESRVLRWRPGVGLETAISATGHANGMTFDFEGRLVVAGWSSRTVWRQEKDGVITTLASHYQGRKLNTPNDIVLRSDGSIYFTDSDGGLFIPGMEGQDIQRYLHFAGVFRISPDGTDLRPVVEDGIFPNGLAFSPDESLLYLSDTRQRHVRVFDVNRDGTLRNGRVFYELSGEEPGHADGLKVDRAGNLYSTGPAGIHVIDPAGRLLGRLRIPEDCTNLAWGGDDARDLFITTFHGVYRTRLKIPGVVPLRKDLA